VLESRSLGLIPGAAAFILSFGFLLRFIRDNPLAWLIWGWTVTFILLWFFRLILLSVSVAGLIFVANLGVVIGFVEFLLTTSHFQHLIEKLSRRSLRKES
jgi:hypothetical protein